MTRILAGIAAGFIATIVLSVLMIAKGMMGLMPHLNVVAMLAGLAGGPLVVGWLIHFLIGSVAWGGAFGLLFDRLPGRSAPVRGMVLATVAWVGMMVLVMPLAGAGLFGAALGIRAPVMTLVLHLIYGAVLGLAFQPLAGRRRLPG